MSGWLLFAFNVPTNLVALCHRSGLRATKKKPRNFFRKFEGIPAERDEARRVSRALKSAGLSIKWIEIVDPEVPNKPPTLRPVTSHEERRQAETLLQRDAYARAAEAVRRARGG